MTRINALEIPFDTDLTIQDSESYPKKEGHIVRRRPWDHDDVDSVGVSDSDGNRFYIGLEDINLTGVLV